MAPQETHSADTVSSSDSGRLSRGIILGVIAAVGYSLANLALRKLADSTQTAGSGWDVWVTGLKGLATGVAAWAIVLKRHARNEPSLPPLKLLPTLILAALVMQFGGNLCFQMALGYLGLAITVPLVFASIICVGALLGRMILGDPITLEVIVAMTVMMVAIVLLSIGTMSATPDPNLPVQARQILMGIGIAVVSGCSYGAVGVLIRYFVRSTLPVESMLIVFSTLGVVVFSGMAVSMSGWQTIVQQTQADWLMIAVASIANAVAFFSVAYALKVVDVNRMNVINASQNAMCAIGAVVVFQEQLSLLALLGIGLTIVGLMALGRRRPQPA